MVVVASSHFAGMVPVGDTEVVVGMRNFAVAQVGRKMRETRIRLVVERGQSLLV